MSFNQEKRSLHVLSESEYSDDFDESDTESVGSYNGKISNNTPNNRFKRSNSSEMNKQFQYNSPHDKMAVRNGGENIYLSQHLDQIYETGQTTGNRKRCYSKNALNARENRIKKKIYVENLEKSVEKYKIRNKKLSLLLESQTNMISDMKKEVKYYKSVIANSKDISRLLTCFNKNTGMPITSSINKSIKFENDTHPWAEVKKNINITDVDKNGELFADNSLLNVSLDTFPSDSPLIFEESLNLPEELFSHPNEYDSFNEDLNLQLNNEHNYNARSPDSIDICDVGVCLHISNQKVSLEFCPVCSEKATSAWKQV